MDVTKINDRCRGEVLWGEVKLFNPSFSYKCFSFTSRLCFRKLNFWYSDLQEEECSNKIFINWDSFTSFPHNSPINRIARSLKETSNTTPRPNYKVLWIFAEFSDLIWLNIPNLRVWWYADKLCNSGDKKILRERQIRKNIEDKMLTDYVTLAINGHEEILIKFYSI